MLVDMLSSQPGVCCDFFIAEEVRDPYDGMRSRAAQVAALGQAAFGIRLLVPHLMNHHSGADIAELLGRLRTDDWTVIHTRRSSLLRTVISYVYAGHHGFHLRDEDGPWRFEPTTIDPDEFSEWLTVVSEWAEIERRALAATRHREIVYEDDLAAETAQRQTITRLMNELLGAPAVPSRTAFRRQLPAGNLSELVLNYAEIMRLLDSRGMAELAEN
jgi:hypothetical protein